MPREFKNPSMIRITSTGYLSKINVDCPYLSLNDKDNEIMVLKQVGKKINGDCPYLSQLTYTYILWYNR